jgi:hypothetical protein
LDERPLLRSGPEALARDDAGNDPARLSLWKEIWDYQNEVPDLFMVTKALVI